MNRNPNASTDEDHSDGQLRIAWRYENLSLNQNTETNKPVFGNTYDLGAPMKSSFIDKAEINQWNETICDSRKS